MLTFRSCYFIIFIVTLLLELYIALFIHDGLVRPYIGDFLVVILMYSFIRSFFNFPVLPICLFVLLFSYLVETLQFFKIVEKLNLQDLKFARVIIGTSFAWADILAYSLGVLCILGIEKIPGKLPLKH